MKAEKSDHEKGGGAKDDKSSDEEEFLGFSPSTDKVGNKSETVVSKADILQASAMARQLHVYKPGIDFVPGARLEVLESRDNNWYLCKIVEVDWGELDILVHYERWSNRFDEWLKMDSTRIRSLSRSSQRRERRSGAFCVGERVLARWSADGKRYLARVTKELADDQYEVLFFDGVAKVLRSAALAKVDTKQSEGEEQRGSSSRQPGTDDEDSLLMSPGATSASSTDSRSSSPEPEQSPLLPGRAEELMEVETISPVRKNIFDVEIIERKRNSKRKAAVEELFQSLKKRRKSETGTRVSVPSPRQQQQVRLGLSRKSSLSKKKVRESSSTPQEEQAARQAEATSSEASNSPVPSQSPRTVSVNMPDGWRKCCSQRTHGSTAGKWDTFYLAPDGKKIRSKNELYRYCEEFGILCDTEKFDFSLKNMKAEVIEASAESKGPLKSFEEQKETLKESFTSQVRKELEVKSPLQESCGISKMGTGKKIDVKKPGIRRVEMVKHSESPRMKLEIPLIPKTEHVGTFPPSLLGASAGPWSPTMPSPLPRSLPATTSAYSEELMSKDPVGASGYVPSEVATSEAPPSFSATPTLARHVLKKESVQELMSRDSVGVSGYAVSEAATELPQCSTATPARTRHVPKKETVQELMSKDPVDVSGYAPSEAGTELPPCSSATPTHTRCMSKKETFQELLTKDPVGMSGYAPSEPTPEALSRPVATPIRQRHVLKKEPVLAPNEFIVVAQHNEHKCPKEACGKSFRKENLLQMHIKHYHPEFLKKSSNWAPNVADLAYARTVGDHLDTSSSPGHSSPAEKAVKSEVSSKKQSRGIGLFSFLDARAKAGDKKALGTIKSVTGAKDSKRKDKARHEADQVPPISEDETEPKEEVEDYIDDLGESPMSLHGLQPEDPDYVPCDTDIEQMRTDRLERRKTRGDIKGKKKKLVPSESLSEDDLQDTKTVTKYRYSKRKGLPSSKASVSPANGEPQAPEPPALTSPAKKPQGAEGEAPSIDAEEDTGDAWVEGTESVPTSEPSAEIINCGCGSTEEEGLMLQCDVCLCWQHGDCYNIVGEDQVPDKYICSLCDHPRLERSSHKFRHHQDWLKEGRLPRFSFSSSRGDLRLETCIRRGHELTANVLQLSQILQSLRLKLHIAKEPDHPKFVMWHKKWDEQEEASSQNKGEISPNSQSVAPLQDLMNIVEQDDPCLSPQIVDTNVSGSTHDLGSTSALERAVTGEPEKFDTSHAIFPRGWDIPGPAATETQGTDLQAGGKTEDVVIPKDQSNKAAMDVIKHSEGNTALPEASDTKCEASEDQSKGESELKDSCSDGIINTAPQDHEPEISLTSEKDSQILEAKPSADSKENILQVKEESKDSIEIAATRESLENSTQIALKEEKTNDSDDALNTDTENTNSIKRDETAPGSAYENEENLQSSDGGQSKEASFHHSPKSILTPRESDSDQDHHKEFPCEKTDIDPEEVKESKTELPTESEAEPVKEEMAGVFEEKTKKESTQEDVKSESQGKQLEESCKEDETTPMKDDCKIEPMDVDMGVTTEDSTAVTYDTNISQEPPKVEEESDIVKMENEELDDKDSVKHSQTKDKEQEQEKLADSSNLASSSITASSTEDTLNEEENQLEDGDELALDLGGLGATGEGGMPGGNELAALLSSQTELEQLVSQASSALAPVTGNVHSVQAPIIPEAERIEPVNCKLNLLEHVQVMQTSITQRFDQIEQQLEVLEAEMGLTADAGEDEAEEDPEERDPATLQARALIKLVMNDLNVVKKIADFTH
ncbi:uncharacterized protein LOC126998827 isoform X4 [Eriocheir sinensis]|uniref:uncharacterized protein LOC126998827 isoform X4 n=1 Tax=Eriocheir sinensis TaxID=95602 RepID=UPI0021C8227D|nr:uncharacterized protein LOC126998827 isoform X4 [Eriocheir sinensis]